MKAILLVLLVLVSLSCTKPVATEPNQVSRKQKSCCLGGTARVLDRERTDSHALGGPGR